MRIGYFLILLAMLQTQSGWARVGFHMHAGYGPLGQLVGSASTTDISAVFTSTATEYKTRISNNIRAGIGAAFNLSYLQYQREKMGYIGTYNSLGVSTSLAYALFPDYSAVLHMESLFSPQLTVKTNSETRVNNVTLKQSQLTTYQDGQGVLTRLAFVRSQDKSGQSSKLPVVFGLSLDVLDQRFTKETVKTNVNLTNVGARPSGTNRGQYRLIYLGIGLRVSVSL